MFSAKVRIMPKYVILLVFINIVAVEILLALMVCILVVADLAKDTSAGILGSAAAIIAGATIVGSLFSLVLFKYAVVFKLDDTTFHRTALQVNKKLKPIIPLNDIVSVKITETGFSWVALSNRKIQIRWRSKGKIKKYIFSPNDAEEFLAELSLRWVEKDSDNNVTTVYPDNSRQP
jgi:hypothetical protein